MPLESGDYISDLNASNPLGVGDPKAQGDDHLRLIKHVLLTTFPAIAGAVTPSHTELNYVDGVTSSIQTQLDGKAASSHNHSAADLTSGTIPDARFPSTLPAVNGSALTNLNASNLASGSVADARLGNAALKNASNSFSAAQTIDNASSLQLILKGSQPQLEFARTTGTATQWDIYAAPGATSLHFFANSADQLVLGHGTFDFKAGVVTTANASASEVGYKGVPVIRTESAGTTLALADSGSMVRYNGSGGHTFTIPAQASINFPIGTVITVVGGSGSLTIAITTDTLYLAATGFATTGSRTLAAGGMATLYKFGSQSWMISGPGVS